MIALSKNLRIISKAKIATNMWANMRIYFESDLSLIHFIRQNTQKFQIASQKFGNARDEILCNVKQQEAINYDHPKICHLWREVIYANLLVYLVQMVLEIYGNLKWSTQLHHITFHEITFGWKTQINLYTYIIHVISYY